jgi:diaminopimelate decarboxylase
MKAGVFQVDGVGLQEVLEQHETPFYLYSAEVIRAKYGQLTERFPGFDIFYSLKANPNLAICRRLLDLGACADVSSMGEIKAALEVGFKSDNMVFVGPGKSDAEIEYAIEKGLYAVAAESAYELELIEALAGKLGRSANVLLRINTCEEPEAPEMMVGGPSKFGFDEERIVEEVRSVNLKHARLAGIHVYSASQVLDAGFISNHLEYVSELALRLSGEIGFDLKCIDFGGGFGVPYAEDDSELDLARISETASGIRTSIKETHPACRLMFEVGRFVVAESGVFMTRSLRIKHSRGKCFVLTDGGMNHFTRPVFMSVNHPVRILNKIGAERRMACSIAGPICTPIDIIARDVMLPEPERGDVIGVFNAGAYGYTMSLINFMSLGWPAEIMVDGGKIHLIRRARPATHLFPDQQL